ncbi:MULTISPECIES: tyrosine-type recombinase/integrase [unclassified Rhizobium]|uniref:tyrosine-type recombinase/integrase n=1 Tax=unclassified Rhizobium TaxID=2613769 RepID=UPI001C833E36|nr:MULTISPECIES: tyrosine-type recombinase/integrase [unclassified Rhizobium]MBX5165710.1 tyrosine-type recombinase/integrase [Rhizobium sp. NZLR4b]MBX5209135.1 tyrosine-type recombinase/integrase [Rhizobium sp. NZLR11]
MVMRISRPMKRAGTKNEQFKKRVPTALLSVLKGKKLSLDLPQTAAPGSATYAVTVTISEMIAFSLGAPASRLAAIRHAAALRHVEAFLDAAQRGPEDLSHLQLTALLGDIHKALLAEHEANPPARYKIAVEDGVEEWNELSEWSEMIADAEIGILALTPQGRAAAVARVRRIIDVDAFLSARALMLSEKSYRDLVEGLPATLRKVVETLTQRSHGNYSADPYASQYPQFKAKPAAAQRSTDAYVKTFDDLFDRWKAADKRAASTISTWRGYLARFTKFIGHDDPHRVERVDALRWKDALVAEGLKKISTTYLAALNTLYRFGLSNSETTGISRNPFDGVKAPQKAIAGTKRQAFTRAEVALILNSARKEKLAHLRWIPWLQAQTGSRVAEIAQLWGNMVITDDAGNPCIHITTAPDGGSLKNEGSERMVPLHPDLIAEGFLEFVRKRGKGPLFYGGSKGKAAVQLRDDQKHPSKGVSNRVGTWVRGLGITDRRKGPTHSFRHWFKSELPRRSGCDSRLVDAIQGHAPTSDAAGYHHAETSEMLEAISKLDLKALADSAPNVE